MRGCIVSLQTTEWYDYLQKLPKLTASIREKDSVIELLEVRKTFLKLKLLTMSVTSYKSAGR